MFDKNFEIANDKIKKIQQFENNLPEFTYLKEVAEHNKKGRWSDHGLTTHNDFHHFAGHSQRELQVRPPPLAMWFSI